MVRPGILDSPSSPQSADRGFVRAPAAEPNVGHVIQLWFVLPNGSKVAGTVHQMPRRGDIVRFADDGEAYEVMQIEHIATPQGTRHGMRYARIVVRLTEWGRPPDRAGR